LIKLKNFVQKAMFHNKSYIGFIFQSLTRYWNV